MPTPDNIPSHERHPLDNATTEEVSAAAAMQAQAMVDAGFTDQNGSITPVGRDWWIARQNELQGPARAILDSLPPDTGGENAPQ